MSKYSEVKTHFTDGPTLLAALADMGYKKVENRIGNPRKLVDYVGSTSQGKMAEIIIPRSEVPGASNEIGFVKNAQGRYEASVSQYDSSRQGTAWLNKLNYHYGVAQATAAAKKVGARLINTGKKLPNGNMQFVYLKA